jgi:hypothetical protein
VTAAVATAASLAVGIAATEALVRGLDLLREPRAWYDEIASAPAPEAAEAPALQTQIHPFLGWIRRPGVVVPYTRQPIPVFPPTSGPSEWAKAQTRTNAFGYLSSYDDYRDLPRDHFVVGVFGGSVAGQLAQIAGDVLRDALRERLPEIGAPIDVLCFGSGGYKQPQQLMALAEMATLGVPLDLVVTLDGFNELVYGLHDAQGGSHPVFPSRNHYETTVSLAAAPSRRATELAGRVVAEQRHSAEAVARVEDSPLLRQSVLVRAIAGSLAHRHANAATALEQELQGLAAAQSAEEAAAVASPPSVACAAQPDACLDLVVDLWADASKAMAGIAGSIGARYVHGLQPSQYFAAGNKPLDDEERQYAYKESHVVPSVQRGYPVLQQRGARLRDEGIAFYDLSGAFAGHTETIYRDDCCHMNAHGNAILARALADAIADALHAGAPPAQRR